MIYIASIQEEVETTLLELATPVANLSRADAIRFSTPRRELGRNQRLEAEQLLEAWEATPRQMQRVDMLAAEKHLAISQDA